MSGFSAEWLRQREPIDLAARDRELARDFAAALKQRQTGTLHIMDLAAGSGANFRALAPLLDGDQLWSLVDHDPVLLEIQVREISHWAYAANWRCEKTGGGVAVHAPSATWRARRSEEHTSELQSH